MIIDSNTTIIDINNESTQPNTEPIKTTKKLQQMIPIIETVATEIQVPISINTMKTNITKTTIETKTLIINDISKLKTNPEIITTCVELNVTIVCIHIQKTPKTIQNNPIYQNIIKNITNYLESQLNHLISTKLPAEQIIFNPNIGFNKTTTHNLDLLSSIDHLHQTGQPVLINHSKKRFLSKLLNHSIEKQTTNTINITIALSKQKIEIIQIHNMATVHDTLIT